MANKYVSKEKANICLFPIQNGLTQGHALTPLLVNFALEYAIKRIQANPDGLN